MTPRFSSLAFFAGPLLVLLLFRPTEARAYTVQTPITPGCHERITADALRIVRASLDTAKPIALASEENALIADMPFDVPQDLCDLGGLTLLVGVRDNDLAGIPATSLDDLVEITAADGSQREHCLRTTKETEPNGTKEAVDDCRKFIVDTLTSSLDGLDAQGSPDPNARESVGLTLSIRGQTNVNLPIFYFRMGRGLHAIEDSFTHDWRSTSDPHKITVALNWTDYADNRINEPVTGPAHESEMDRCDDPDALRAARRGLATEAAAEALHVALDPTLSRAAKIAGFQQVIDTYVVFDDQASCTSANGWCNAPERAYAPSACGCRAAGAPTDDDAAMLTGAAALALLFFFRRRRTRASLALASILAVSIFSSSRASAADVDAGASPSAAPSATTPPPSTPGGEAVPGVTPPMRTQPVPETSSGSGPVNALAGKSSSGKPGVEDLAGAKFAAVGFAASYDKSALMGRIGGRYALSRTWMVGLDAEWNPYLAVGQSTLRSGSLDAYASLIARFQLAFESINLRSSVSLGGSMLLFDLVGAPAGSVGPYFGISLLGLEVKLGKGFYFIVEPDSIAIPVPHVTGIPFVYYQYRFQIGIEFGG